MWVKALVSASICHAEVSWRETINPWQLWQTKESFLLKVVYIMNVEVVLLLFHNKSHSSVFFSFCSHGEMSARMSGMDVTLVDRNDTGLSSIDNGTFLRFSPTSSSTSAAASSPGRPGNVYVYVWLFLGLLVFLLTLLIISLHRLKNIISSSSSIPDCSSEGGSSFTNMEICSISSQRSTISTLST